MAVIDLSQLPAPDVVETLDFETILAERKATLVSLYPEDEQEAVARALTLESEPLVKYLERMPTGRLFYASVLTRRHRPAWWPMPSKRPRPACGK